jgi:hypothetical protein
MPDPDAAALTALSRGTALLAVIAVPRAGYRAGGTASTGWAVGVAVRPVRRTLG